MAATRALVEALGPYTIDDETRFTKKVFDALLSAAQTILDSEDPGLSSSSYDVAHAYMVLHLYEVKVKNTDKVSESLGDRSYSKGEIGTSGFLVEYRNILAGGVASAVLSGVGDGVARNDATTPEADPDQGEVMSFDEDDTYDWDGGA